jgi:hypothetical protein
MNLSPQTVTASPGLAVFLPELAVIIYGHQSTLKLATSYNYIVKTGTSVSIN